MDNQTIQMELEKTLAEIDASDQSDDQKFETKLQFLQGLQEQARTLAVGLHRKRDVAQFGRKQQALEEERLALGIPSETIQGEHGIDSSEKFGRL